MNVRKFLGSDEKSHSLEPHTGDSPQGGKRTSGEGVPERSHSALARPPIVQASARASFLRHNLTSPEKRTLKRIEALRRSLRDVEGNPAAGSVDSIGARILDHLKADRGLHGNIPEEGYFTLASLLVDKEHLDRPAATLVGDWLRDIGATELPTDRTMRVKAALRELNEALFDPSRAHEVLAVQVKELKLEKRDGGLQIVALLRQQGNEADVRKATHTLLGEVDLADVDVRCVRPAPPRAGGPIRSPTRPLR